MREMMYDINPIAGTNQFDGNLVSFATGFNPTNWSLAGNLQDIEDRMRGSMVPAQDPLSAQYAYSLVRGDPIDPNNIEGDATLNTFETQAARVRAAQAQGYDESLEEYGSKGGGTMTNLQKATEYRRMRAKKASEDLSNIDFGNALGQAIHEVLSGKRGLMWNGQKIKASKELVDNHNREMSGLYGGGRSEPEEYQPGEPRGDDDDDEEDDMDGAGGAEAAQRAATSGVDTESAEDRVAPSNNYKPINPRARDQDLNNTLMKLQTTMAALTSSFNTYGANSYNKATDQLRIDRFHGDLGGKIDGMSGDIRSISQVLDTSLKNVSEHNRTYIDDNVNVIRTTAQEVMNTQLASSLALQNQMKDLVHSMTDNYSKDRKMMESVAAMTMDLHTSVSDLKTTLDNRGNYEMGQQQREYEMIDQVKTINRQISEAVKSMGEINVSDIIAQFKSATGSDQVHGSLDRIKSLISEIVQSNQKHTLISSGMNDKVQIMNMNHGRILDELRGEIGLLRTTLPSTNTIDDLLNKMEKRMDLQWANGLALNDENFKKVLEVVESIDTDQEVNANSVHENHSTLTKLVAQMDSKLNNLNDLTQTAYTDMISQHKEIYAQVEREAVSTRTMVGEGVVFNEAKNSELKMKVDELANNASAFASAEAKVDLSRGTIVTSETKESAAPMEGAPRPQGNVPGHPDYNPYLDEKWLPRKEEYGANHIVNIDDEIDELDTDRVAAEAAARAMARVAQAHNYANEHMKPGRHSSTHKNYVTTSTGDVYNEVYPWGTTVSEETGPYIHLLNEIFGYNFSAMSIRELVANNPANTYSSDISFTDPSLGERGFITETGGNSGVDFDRLRQVSINLMSFNSNIMRLLGSYLNSISNHYDTAQFGPEDLEKIRRVSVFVTMAYRKIQGSGEGIVPILNEAFYKHYSLYGSD